MCLKAALCESFTIITDADCRGKHARYLLDALAVVELRVAHFIRIKQCERQADRVAASVRATSQRLSDCVGALVGAVFVRRVRWLVCQRREADSPGQRHRSRQQPAPFPSLRFALLSLSLRGEKQTGAERDN